MEDKKIFQDKRWTQNPGGEVIGYEEVTKEEKEWAEKELEKLINR